MRRWALGLAAGAALAASARAADLPWDREESLRHGARGLAVVSLADSQCPQPAGDFAGGGALAITNPEIKASLWGPPSRITLSLIKTDVWDRRRGVGPEASSAYPFPCQKPVGQIILGLDELAGSSPARLTQSCRDGTVRVQAGGGAAGADLEILLSMTRNVFAVRGRVTGVAAPWLRLYRHRDQAHLRYMTPDGHWIRNGYDYAADAAWNGPLDPPTSGTDGTFFWIRQRLPAEKTFPRGFDYVLVGFVPGKEQRGIATAEGAGGLGTPPSIEDPSQAPLAASYGLIRQAPGAAATAVLAPARDGSLEFFATVVTANDSADPLAEAERRLRAAAAAGFAALRDENAGWYGRLYDERENGRVFYGNGGTGVSADIPSIFRSWYCRSGGGCQPDIRRNEASGPDASVEQDWSPGHGLPDDDLFYTPTVVWNRADSLDMWLSLAGRLGGAGDSGLKVSARAIKILWDEWDYGSDEGFLRARVYPALRDLANRYLSRGTAGADRGNDIGFLAMARWTFLRADRAAEMLGLDPELRYRWRAAAGQIPSYPTLPSAKGNIFTGVEPVTWADEITLDSQPPLLQEMIRTAYAAPDPAGARALVLLGACPDTVASTDPAAAAIDDSASLRREIEREPERLLNSRSGRIYVFPCVPGWAQIGFRRFQARGGFLVSAVKSGPNVSLVEIEARRDDDCRLIDPWPGRPAVVQDATAGVQISYENDYSGDNARRECIEFPAERGHDYLIREQQ